MQALMDRIAVITPEGGEWCSVDKAHGLAALIVALRPTIIVEIGVWQGGSLIPMALACKHVRHGTCLAIDPWKREASIAGEDAANSGWWGQVDHEKAYNRFIDRVMKHDVGNYVEVLRLPSDDVSAPLQIDLLHIDGNHTDQAIRDVEHFAPKVRVGGVVVMDDIGWKGGNVGVAVAKLVDMGFRELYPLGTGAVFQKIG